MANEKRLISESERADLIRCLKKIHNCDFTPGVYEHSVIGRAALLLEETADAVEVVHGRWIEKVDMVESYFSDCTEVFYECSVCECANIGESPYCPNCGAKMNGGNEDAER